MYKRSYLHTYVLRLWLSLAGGLFTFHFAPGQPEIIRFNRLTDEEGLPNNLFRQIIQDKEGLLWMSGLDGLLRYDGYTFMAFRHSHLDTTTISGNNISHIYEDSKGRLWIGVNGVGLNVSDRNKASFQKVHAFNEIIESPVPRVIDIAEDIAGRIWLVTERGLYAIQEDSGRWICLSYQDVWKNKDISLQLEDPVSIFADPDDKLWIGTERGLFMYDPKFDRWYSPTDFKGLPVSMIQDIEMDRENRLWVSCQNKGARLYHTATDSFAFRPLSAIPFRTAVRGVSFAFDLDNRIWISEFGEQAYGFDFRDSTLFLESSVNSEIIHERFFRKPFVDHSGNTWLPLEGFYIYPYPKGFHTYRHPYAFHQSNSCVYGWGHELWFGIREKGLVKQNIHTGEILHFSESGGLNRRIPEDHIQDVLKVRSGNLILVGHGQISVMDPHGRILFNHKAGGNNRAAFEDTKGRIWIGGFNGLHLFSESEGVIKTYSLPPLNGDARNFIQAIAEDRQGNLWFASDLKGLGMLHPESGRIRQFLPIEGEKNSLPSISVVDLVMDEHQTLWLATDVALVRFDPVALTFTSFDKSDGIANDYISSVVYGRDKLIWVSTHSGISSFDPESERFVNYSTEDGLANKSYYNRSKYSAPDGMLYFGGKNGVDYFHPSRLRTNPTAPRMFLAGVKVNGEQMTMLQDSGGHGKTLFLSYKDNVLEIEMAALHYAGQDGIRYMYRMQGLRDDWIDLGDQRKVLFSGLRPGAYLFEAKAISSDKVWTAQPLSLPIHLKPPYYGTAWFRLIGILLLLGMLYFLITYRERSLQTKDRQKAEVNRKMAELEKRALQAQMNPHFIYNSMNSIQQFMIIQDIEGAMKYLTKFSRILRTVLNISSQNRIPLHDEIKLIEDYLELENMRFPNKFTYTIHVSPDINIHSVEIPPFFIQPQVENAVRHGLLRKATQGHLRIEIRTEGPHLTIVVEDNGVGREAARSAKYQGAVVNESKGLAIVEERLSHMHSENGFKPFKIIDLYDTSDRPAGTRVEITLPLDS